MFMTIRSYNSRCAWALWAVVMAPEVIGIWHACPMHAQTDGAPPAFEVASVRPARPVNIGTDGASRETVEFGVDRLTARNAPINTLLQVAFTMTWFQLGDHAALFERFDIDAKSAGPASRGQLRQMLQALLMDRFKLRVRAEAKEMPVYALVIAKGGHKLHEATGGPNAGFELVNLVSGLWDRLNAPVVNLTGLTGRYDNKVNWGAFNDPVDPESAIRAALESQFGLKLDRRRAKVDFLVIDHLERAPSEN
jgi:hypothetical protein